MKGRRLIVDENGCALEYVRCCSPIFYEHTAEHTEYFYGTPCSSSRRDQMACNYQGAAQPLHASCLFRSFFSFRHNLLQEAGLQEDHSLEQRNETFRNLILQQHLHIWPLYSHIFRQKEEISVGETVLFACVKNCIIQQQILLCDSIFSSCRARIMPTVSWYRSAEFVTVVHFLHEYKIMIQKDNVRTKEYCNEFALSLCP